MITDETPPTLPSSNPPALSGIRVLDLSTVVFGPYASMILADYGADVIKIEAPAGDPVRSAGPGWEDGRAALFLGVNRNKRSVVLDLKRPEGRDALGRLLQDADVLLTSMRPHKAVTLGLEPEAVLAAHPRLIYAELSGFGAGGRYRERPAYDDIVQGLSGAADLMARLTDEPRYLPTILADKISGSTAAHAILAALFQREATGRGQLVEVPLFETTVAFLLAEHFGARHLMDESGRCENRPAGYARILSRWRRPYRTADGYVCVMPYSDRHWRSLLTEAGRDDLAADPRFGDLAARTENIDELYRLTADLLGDRTTDQWLTVCAELDIPAARVNGLDDLESDPHLTDVGFFVDLADGDQRFRFPRSPVRLADSQVQPTVPPRLGADTDTVLGGIGLTPEEIASASGA